QVSTREGYAYENPETDAARDCASPRRPGGEQHRWLGPTRDGRRSSGAGDGTAGRAALARADARGDPGRARGRPTPAGARQRNHRVLDPLTDRSRTVGTDLRHGADRRRGY